MTHQIFVYGTLRNGWGNHRAYLRDQTFVGEAVTRDPFVMRSMGGFPVVLRGRADEPELPRPIFGEVYEVTDEALRLVDGLEGHPTWYEREEVPVDLNRSGIFHTCWMYIGTHFNLPHRLPLCDLNEEGEYTWRH